MFKGKRKYDEGEGKGGGGSRSGGIGRREVGTEVSDRVIE